MTIELLNASIRDIGIPIRMKRLPINDRGYPIPFFVATVNGKPDFRAVDPAHFRDCVTKRLCWLCGDRLGQYLAFTIGPMCSVNRINSEPPSHLACAQYAVRACPFLANPRMRRNEVDMPAGTIAGEHIAHNPGAVAIWVTKSYKIKHVQGGVLFELGDPTNVMWYCEGRPAWRGEIIEAIYRGLPSLEKHCVTQRDKDALTAAVARAMAHLPSEERDHARQVRQREFDRQGVRGGGADPAQDGITDTG